MERKSELVSRSLPFPTIGREPHYFPSPQFPEQPNWREKARRRERLSQILADEIGPRLRLFHHRIRVEASPVEQLGPAEIAKFAVLTTLRDNAAASLYFDEMRARNLSVESLFVGLLAPAARYLEDSLDQDRCDLVDFTMGIARLQQFLAVFGAMEPVAASETDHRALLVTMPGERQSFDRDLIGALMRGGGWEISTNTCPGAKDAAALVSHEWFGIWIVTLNSNSGLDAVAAMIKAVKRASSNASIGIMVSGRVFADDPALAVQVGADVAASDATSAVVLAERLIRHHIQGY